MNDRPLYIFDLDGTVANAQHRVHLIADKKHARWPQFYAACKDDTPIKPVCETARRLFIGGGEIWFFTGRSDECSWATYEWVRDNHLFGMADGGGTVIVMRQEGDYRADHVVKEEMLRNMLAEDRDRLVAVFDDRQQVVDMWRRNGVPCFQVAPGDF